MWNRTSKQKHRNQARNAQYSQRVCKTAYCLSISLCSVLSMIFISAIGSTFLSNSDQCCVATELHLDRIQWQLHMMRATAEVVAQGVQQEEVVLWRLDVFTVLQQTKWKRSAYINQIRLHAMAQSIITTVLHNWIISIISIVDVLIIL